MQMIPVIPMSAADKITVSRLRRIKKTFESKELKPGEIVVLKTPKHPKKAPSSSNLNSYAQNVVFLSGEEQSASDERRNPQDAA
jgi:hypothetical protein